MNNPNKFGQSGKTECPAKLFALTALLTIIVNTLPKRSPCISGSVLRKSEILLRQGSSDNMKQTIYRSLW